MTMAMVARASPYEDMTTTENGPVVILVVSD